MKKIIFLLVAMMVSTATLYAQQTKAKGAAQKKQELTPEQRADKITARLTKELSLTEEQTPKVKQTTLNRVNQLNAAKKTADVDKKAFGQERKKIFQNWETEMKGILTTEQYNTYLKKKEEKKQKIQQNRTANKAKQTAEEIDEDLLDE